MSLSRALVLLSTAALVACGTAVDLGGSGAEDGGPAQCGELVSPSTPASCRACEHDASDCQENGCYGGYWCNTVIADGHAPPKTCP